MPAFFIPGICYPLSPGHYSLVWGYCSPNTFSFRLTFAVRTSSAT